MHRNHSRKEVAHNPRNVPGQSKAAGKTVDRHPPKIQQLEEELNFYQAILQNISAPIGHTLDSPLCTLELERYRAIVEDQTEMVCRFLPDCTLTFVNDAYCRNVGLQREELLGSSFLSFIMEKDREAVQVHLNSFNSDFPVQTYEHEVVRSDGEVIWQQWTDRAIFNSNKEIIEFQSVGRDITERKRMEQELVLARNELENRVKERTEELTRTNRVLTEEIVRRRRVEEALKQSQRYINDIINSLPDAMMVINAYGQVIAWNQAARDLTGISADEILGRGDYEYAISFYGHRRPLLADMVLSQDMEMTSQYRHIEKKGETMIAEAFCTKVGEKGSYLKATATPLYDTHNKMIGAIESIRDISEYKKAGEALKASEAMYRRMVETANEGIWIINHMDCTTYSNSTLAAMLGYTVEEMIGLPIYHFVEPSYVDIVHEQLQRRRLGISEKYDLEMLCKDGSIISTIMSSKPIVGENGEYQGSLGMITDITQRKTLEKQMAQLDRLNLVGEIAAGIGHEIRNPMTAVRGFLQLLGEKPEYGKDQEYFKLMLEELDRANTIITEFLTLARDRILNIQMHNLNTVIKTIYPLIQAEAMVQDKDVKMDLEEIPALWIDEGEIRQLLLNLVRNGLEAMNPGKTLTLATRAMEHEVILIVKDEGQGIQAEILDKLGTPFVTTRDNGTGLGLAVCYSIVNRHKASIHFDSSEQGTTVQVRFKKP